MESQAYAFDMEDKQICRVLDIGVLRSRKKHFTEAIIQLKIFKRLKVMGKVYMKENK